MIWEPKLREGIRREENLCIHLTSAWQWMLPLVIPWSQIQTHGFWTSLYHKRPEERMQHVSNTLPLKHFAKRSCAIQRSNFDISRCRRRKITQQLINNASTSSTVLEDLRQLLAITRPRQVTYIELGAFLDRRRSVLCALNSNLCNLDSSMLCTSEYILYF